MAVNRAAIRDLLLPGLSSVRGLYKEQDEQWSRLFTTKSANMAFERSAQMRYLSAARVKAEGANTYADNNAGERFVYNTQMYAVGILYFITREAIEDNLYEKQFKPANLGLQKSYKETKNIFGADIFNSGTTVIQGLGGDGKALFATDHPVDTGTFANKPTIDVELNESSLLNAQTTIPVTFVDQAGLQNNIRARTLLVPPQLEPTAIRLTKAVLRPGTSDNDPNAIAYTMGGIPDGYAFNTYLTNEAAWFLLTDAEGLIHYDRTPFEMDMFVDDNTDNLGVKCYGRYAFTYEDPRAAYGSFPSN